MNIYRAAVRNGGPILFCIALIVFAISFGAQFKLGDQMTYTQYSSHVGDGGIRFVFLMSALATALGDSAFLFLGACLVDRADRFLTVKGAAE